MPRYYDHEISDREWAAIPGSEREPVINTPKPKADQPANPGFCCSTCGQGFDFGCRCPDY